MPSEHKPEVTPVDPLPVSRHTRSLMELDAVVKGLEDAVSELMERLAKVEAWAEHHNGDQSHITLIGGPPPSHPTNLSV